MAKIKFGMMMTDARGKLGGQVFSKNRSGAYIRTKVTPVNPRTTFQQNNRQLLGSLSAGWSALTESQRTSWNSAVESWQKTNVFGDLMKPTGKNLFTSLNKVAAQFFPDRERLLNPPAKVEFSPYGRVDPFYTVSGNSLVILFQDEFAVGRKIAVRATPVVSNGTVYVKNLLRNIGTNYNVPPNGEVNVGAAYVARFGAVPLGSKLYVEVREVAENGQLGVPTIYLVRVAA